jgi:nicotinamidase-related amidase
MSAATEIDRNDVGLVLVDAQERLAGAMPEAVLSAAVRRWVSLVEMAALYKLPVAVSEQYPKGLGQTLPVLREALVKVMPPARYLEKITFSCCDAPLFDQFLGGGRNTWIVAGMETHVCVYQTVRGLLARGYRVHVPIDAVVSRTKLDWRAGVGLMERLGAVVTSTETVLFDLVRRAEGPEFRALQKLVK